MNEIEKRTEEPTGKRTNKVEPGWEMQVDYLYNIMMFSSETKHIQVIQNMKHNKICKILTL
jgi:hypothetical protein